jgi:formamidopyrimidine-DNA glycosylase
MPELPEVETIRRSLAVKLPNRTVTDILIRDSRLREPVNEERLNQLICGRKVVNLSRRAKYLLIHFDGGSCLILHLGMSGRLLLLPATHPFDKHDHVIFAFDNDTELRLRDPRRFGSVAAVIEAELSEHPPLRRLGPEPLSPECTALYLFERSRKSKKPVKNFVMDQQVVVGVGNIYASESLFLARIHPLRAAGRISYPRWQKLLSAIKRVLTAAIKQGGTTLSDFRDSNGEMGYFQVKLRAYGRAGLPCFTCGTAIRVCVLGGRSTFYCPKCQT